MSIYSFYENTYKKINNSSVLSKFMPDIKIKEFNSCCDVCKSIDKNIILLSLCGENTSYMDRINTTAHDQIIDLINDNIFSNKAFINELTNQLMNYNIDINHSDQVELSADGHGEFLLTFGNYIMTSYNMDEISNILNNTVINFTNIVYNKFYKNEFISNIFNYFKNLENAGIRCDRNKCSILPNMNDEAVYISVTYNKVFKKHDV